MPPRLPKSRLTSPNWRPTSPAKRREVRTLLRTSPVLFALADGGLGGGQPGDRHAVGGAADVIQAQGLAEGDGGRVAAVLAADAELGVGALGAAALGGDADQVADALLVEADEGVLLEDALVDIGVEEPPRVVAADAEGCLGQVVGAEGEELGVLRQV